MTGGACTNGQKRPRFWRFAAMNQEKMLVAAASDKGACLALSRLRVHPISHKPINQTGIRPLKNPMGLLLRLFKRVRRVSIARNSLKIGQGRNEYLEVNA
jgi:hypothetical protein